MTRKERTTEKEDTPDELAEIRRQILAVDRELSRLICRRLELAKLAGEMKHVYNVPIRAPDVEKRTLERVKGEFREMGQDEKAAEAIWKELMKWSLEVQTEWF